MLPGFLLNLELRLTYDINVGFTCLGGRAQGDCLLQLRFIIDLLYTSRRHRSIFSVFFGAKVFKVQ